MKNKYNLEDFKANEFYAFGWIPANATTPILKIEFPVWVNKHADGIQFRFTHGRGFESLKMTIIKKTDIFAVKNDQGTVKIKGYDGRYLILNDELFKQYLSAGMFEIES